MALQSLLNSGLIEFSNTNTCIHGSDGRGLWIYCGIVPPQTYEIEIVVLDLRAPDLFNFSRRILEYVNYLASTTQWSYNNVNWRRFQALDSKSCSYDAFRQTLLAESELVILVFRSYGRCTAFTIGAILWCEHMSPRLLLSGAKFKESAGVWLIFRHLFD